MAAQPLSLTVDASRSERSWRSSAVSLFTSTLLQGSALAILIVTPLLVADSLPAPANRAQLPDFVSVIPVPKPPPPSAPARQPGRRRPSPVPVAGFSPVDLPDRIPDEPVFGPGAGAEEGVPGGIDGGVPGMPPPPVPEEPAEEDPEPVVPGGDIRPPRKLVHVSPIYPPVASAAKVEGIVVLEAILDRDGNVVNVKVLRSIPLLDGAAVDAVRRWKYEPTHLNGQPVPVILTVTVEFRLRR